MTWDKDSFLEWELAAWAQRGSGGSWSQQGSPGTHLSAQLLDCTAVSLAASSAASFLLTKPSPARLKHWEGLADAER